jgi:hypothetical protein
MKKDRGLIVSEMREEYDFSGGVRGKYAARYREGCNVVLLDPDVAEAFPDSKSVNRMLRALIQLASKRVKKSKGKSTR